MTTTESLPALTPNGQLSHDQILAATERCLRDHGYDATTIRRIAKSLDCAVGSIYRYFTDKRELLLAVTQRLIEPVCELLESGASFESSVDLYLELAGKDCQPYRLMFWLSCEGMDPGDPGAALPPVVRRIIDAWAIKLGDALLAQRCWSMVHGAVIAGLPAQTARLSALDLADAATHGDQGGAMAQIVTLLKQPPQPAAQPQTQASEDVVLL